MKHCLLKLGVALTITGAALGCDSKSAGWAESEAASTAAQRAVEAVSVARPSASATTPAPIEASAQAEPKKIDAPEVVDLEAPLEVKRLVVAHGVEQREPMEPTASFIAGQTQRIYAFVEVSNPESARSEIHVSFAKAGEPESGAIVLRVGESPRWRTWAYTRQADEPGKWQVIVRDGKGKELSRGDFEVLPEADAPAA